MVDANYGESDLSILKENNKLINKNCIQLLSSIQDILDYNSLAKNEFLLHKEDFNLIFVVREIIDIVKFNVGNKQVEIILENQIMDAGKVVIRNDVNRFKQILMCLLLNAIKFTEEGTIKVKVSLQIEKDLIKVDVQDTGCGIKESL